MRAHLSAIAINLATAVKFSTNRPSPVLCQFTLNHTKIAGTILREHNHFQSVGTMSHSNSGSCGAKLIRKLPASLRAAYKRQSDPQFQAVR